MRTNTLQYYKNTCKKNVMRKMQKKLCARCNKTLPAACKKTLCARAEKTLCCTITSLYIRKPAMKCKKTLCARPHHTANKTCSLNGCHARAACDARRDRATRPATPRQRNFSTRSRVACIDAGATSSESVVHWRGSGSLAQVEAAADSLAQQGIWQGPRHTRANLCRRRFRERNTSVVPSPSSSRRFYPCACNAVRGIETGP